MRTFFLLATFIAIALASEHFPSNVWTSTIKLGGEKSAPRSFSLETIVSAPGASWIRVFFSDKTNAPSIRISSLKDGAVQHLNRETLAQWQFSSAYFNGDSVLVEMFDQAGHVNDFTVEVQTIQGGLPVMRQGADNHKEKSLCGPDSRELSNHKRAGRYLGGGGCSGWIINDKKNCFLTAHHCGTDSTGGGVMEFEVPLSEPTGTGHTIVHPPPEHQYAVDPASLIRAQTPVGVGNDWQYFGVFPNTETGLTAYERQKDHYILSTNLTIPAFGTLLRQIGYGVVEFDRPEEWNQAQKVSFGPFSHDKIENNGKSWSFYYTVDTTGGDSGSAVEIEGGAAIGIHTHGGCSRLFGGVNYGTFIGNPSLQSALENPKGVCA